MYSVNSETTKVVCRHIGWIFDIHPIKTMRRGSIIYVTGTLLKPDEWRKLRGFDGDVIEDGSTLRITGVPGRV
jgi:hypothetical protein